jgi:hypothetical protein
MTIRTLLWFLFGLAIFRAVARIAFLSTGREVIKYWKTRSGVSFSLVCTLVYAGVLLYVLLTH